jgi:lysophospholipase L1-like esterase/dienelactone hydrolase
MECGDSAPLYFASLGSRIECSRGCTEQSGVKPPHSKRMLIMKSIFKQTVILLMAFGCFSPCFASDFLSLDGKVLEQGNNPAADGRIRKVELPVLHFVHTSTTNRMGTVMLLPGGGYQVLAIEHEGIATAKFLNDHGFDVAILEYTIASGEKTRDMALKDALSAFRLIKKEPAKYGLNGTRFGIMGYSAGGHLAARTASALDRNEQPDDLILIYPAYLDEKTTGSHIPAVKPPVNPTARLFAIIAANDDKRWVASCREYSATWKETGGESHLEILPDGGHGFGIKRELPGSAKQWPDMLAKFLSAPPMVRNQTNLTANTAVIPVPKLENDSYDWYERHKQVLAVKDSINPEIVLIGDSITHFWGGDPKSSHANGPKVWEALFGKYRVLNLGFGWDRTQNVLWRLDHGELDGLHPRKVIIHIGTNNTSGTGNARQNTPTEIVEGISAICERVKSKVPGAQIVLMQVFPREQKPDAPRRLQIKEINRLLVEFGKANKIDVLDLAPKMLQPDGTLPKDLMSDFCHPTEKGYQIWADALKSYLD